MFTKKRSKLPMHPLHFLMIGNRYRTLTQCPNAIFQTPRHNIIGDQTAETTLPRKFLIGHHTLDLGQKISLLVLIVA
jgi:hypothetical protein